MRFTRAVKPLVSLYVVSLQRVLRFQRASSFALGSALHAGGHAALALAAGKCAGALAGGQGLLAPGSTGASFNPRRADALGLALLGLAAVAVKAAGGAWAEWEEARTCGDVGAALRLRLLDGFLAQTRLRHPRHGDQGVRSEGSDRATPNALAAMTEHVRELEAGLRAGLLGASRAILQLAPLVAILAWLELRLALVASVCFATFALALGRARRAWKGANARDAKNREALVEAADEAVKHADLWTTYGAEARVRAHVARVGEALAAHAAKIAASASALSGANEVLGAAALVLAIAAARAGWLGAGEASLLPFAVTFFLAYRPIRDLSDARHALARASAAHAAIAPLFAEGESAARDDAGDDEPITASEGARESGEARRAWPLAELRVESLVLARGMAGAPITMRVEPGALVAVVGPTGIGKSTLLRTLLGLEAPRGGEVRYGGARVDASAVGPRARPFAWVPQDAPVLADSIEANVALADGASDAREALEAIGATRLARDSAARVGAGGRALSGGERQWVAIARAVATRLPVLLLDEPTSGLDRASEARVLDAIARLRGERTVILVTHRDEPLAIVDRVVRLGARDGEAPIARAS